MDGKMDNKTLKRKRVIGEREDKNSPHFSSLGYAGSMAHQINEYQRRSMIQKERQCTQF